MPAKQPVVTVAERPVKPLFIYDGECNFCKFWILRWQRFTRGRVDYAASQEAGIAERFPELPRERFEESVQFVETDGRVYSAAEAVFRSMSYGRTGGGAFWLYRNIPGFAAVTEWGYRFVARRRTFFSRVTRWFFGEYR